MNALGNFFSFHENWQLLPFVENFLKIRVFMFRDKIITKLDIDSIRIHNLGRKAKTIACFELVSVSAAFIRFNLSLCNFKQLFLDIFIEYQTIRPVVEIL